MFKVMSVKIEARNVDGIVSYQYGVHMYNDEMPEGEREQTFQGEVASIEDIEDLFTETFSPAADKMLLKDFELS